MIILSLDLFFIYKKVKKQQQHVLFVLAGHHVDYKEIDIADPSNEEEKQLMTESSKPNSKGAVLPPQIFNENEYCGVSLDFYCKIL